MNTTVTILPSRPDIERCDVPDALFASCNEYGIPTLDLRYQANYCELPVLPWGSQKRNQKFWGTYHFYTEDYRFEKVWADCTPLVNSGCRAAVEPNFSTSEQMPRAVSLYQIYRKRWLARFWQSHGIRIWVDLNVAIDLYDLNFLGVPHGWRSYMTRGYSHAIETLHYEYALARAHRAKALDGDGDDLLFAVVGGSVAVREACQVNGWINVPEFADLRKGKF